MVTQGDSDLQTEDFLSGEKLLLINARLVGYHDTGFHVVRVEQGKVVWIGPSDDEPAARQEGETIVDLRGRWLAPSMIDWHVHSKLAAHYFFRLNLQECKSAQSVIDSVRVAVRDPKYNRPELVAINMRNGDWNDGHILTRETLDREVSSERPIFLFYNGYHSMVCNSVALQKVGIAPEGHHGHIVEQEAFEATLIIGHMEDEVMDKCIQAWALNAAALGVTEIVDLEQDFNIRDWQRRCINGFDTLRVHAGLYEHHYADAIARGVKTGDIVADTKGLITVGPYKLVTDGGLGSQTAYCHDPYPHSGDHGVLAFTADEIRDITRKATAAGFKLAVHAIGDEANTITLKTLASNPEPPLPGSTIEHAQLLDFADIELFKRLNLIASVQPRHLVDDRETCLKYWAGRENRAWALKTLADNGVRMKFGSDCPVAEMDPWEAMAVAVSRRGKGGLPLSEEQAVDVETAWLSSTSNGALSIRKNDRADIVVIDRNPLSCDAESLRATRVWATMLGGRWTYTRK